MKQCAECIRARHRVVHKTYTDECEGCAVRRLAYLPLEDRERYYDRVQHLGGLGDRAECIKLVTEERARIAALAQAMPKAQAGG